MEKRIVCAYVKDREREKERERERKRKRERELTYVLAHRLMMKL